MWLFLWAGRRHWHPWRTTSSGVAKGSDFSHVRTSSPSIAPGLVCSPTGSSRRSVASASRRASGKTKIQFSAGALGASARLGLPIQEAWVVGLIKGRREGDTYNPETKRREGNPRQQSVLCYGWKKPGNPRWRLRDWQVSYDYVGEDGKNHRLGKA